MKVIFISLILIFIFSVSAEGSDWEYVCTGLEGNKWYVDKDSIKHTSKNVVRAWIRELLPNNCKSEIACIEKVMAYEEHNCKEGNFRFLETLFYYRDGSQDD